MRTNTQKQSVRSERRRHLGGDDGRQSTSRNPAAAQFGSGRAGGSKAVMALMAPGHLGTASRSYIQSHNAIRGFAAIGVFAYHLQLENAYGVPLGLAEGLVKRGYVWVDLFFILSGFVISLTYQTRLAGLSWSPIRKFLLARVARILPLHLFALLYLGALVLGMEGLYRLLGWSPHWSPVTWRDIGDLGLQAALVQIWSRDATMSWNIPSWSVSAEMHIYILFVPIAGMLARRPRATMLCLAVISVAIYLFILLNYANLDILTPVALLRCLAGFALGTVLQNIHRTYPIAPAWLIAAQSAALLAIGAVLVSGLHDVFLIPAFVLLVVSTASDGGLVGRATRGRLAQWLGDISYSIYLLNFPILLSAGLFWPKLEPLLPAGWLIPARLAWMALLLMVLVAAAGLTFRFIEVPARRRMRGTSRLAS